MILHIRLQKTQIRYAATAYKVKGIHCSQLGTIIAKDIVRKKSFLDIYCKINCKC